MAFELLLSQMTKLFKAGVPEPIKIFEAERRLLLFKSKLPVKTPPVNGRYVPVGA